VYQHQPGSFKLTWGDNHGRIQSDGRLREHPTIDQRTCTHADINLKRYPLKQWIFQFTKSH